MTQQNNNNQGGAIEQVSNELEFNIQNTSARSILNHNGLPIVGEVNPQHLIELNVSLAEDADELNNNLAGLVNRLRQTTNFLGGELYAGSSLLQDVSNIEPARYRTTSLSETCARGFLDITSQQIVIGVSGEEFGVALFNTLRNLNPVFLALTNSSPYRIEGNELVDTGYQSRRIGTYQELTRYFPNTMLESQDLESREHFDNVLRNISTDVHRYLVQGQLDVNVEELLMQREGGAYYPFDTLDPHQIYWMTRFRPDHVNERSDFTIEMRVCDIPTTTQRMQGINSYVIGLAYYMQEHGFELPRLTGEEFENLHLAAEHGLDARIGGQTLQNYVQELLPYAQRGLELRGNETNQMNETITDILENGNCAQQLRRQNFTEPQQLINYLVAQLER